MAHKAGRSNSVKALSVLLLGLVRCAAQDEEGRAMLLLHKKIFPTEGFAVNQPINVTLTVYNKGPGNANSLFVRDDNWKQDKFRIIAGGNNFTLHYLNAGDSHEHTFTVKPIKKTWHRVRPAKMEFSDGQGDDTILHLSNTLPEFRIAAPSNWIEENLLTVGRVITLNNVKTKEGWMFAGGIIIFLLVVQLYFVASSVLQKRRHLRALEDVKNM
ncbi:hypothetical protein AB1Y20_020330 [Prymnesium parvum]|uniref:Translocon-associated protein subunit beta n=1 Tax=Prymnesium parvum TaxID=97485 RepID=A0AB34JX24_PRYPA